MTRFNRDANGIRLLYHIADSILKYHLPCPPIDHFIYVGSAFGPGGIKARVSRHIKTAKKLKWHIDYLRKEMDLQEVFHSTAPEHLECKWAKAISDIQGVEYPLKGFGSSDCRCYSHLLYFTQEFDFDLLHKTVTG